MLKDNEPDVFGFFVFLGLFTCVIFFGLEIVKYFPNDAVAMSRTTERRVGGCICE